VNEAVSAAWDKVAEDWATQSRHDALLALAVEKGELKWVASKYRERKGDAIADAQLAKLTNAAMASMMATGATKGNAKDLAAPYKRALLWLMIMTVMLMFGLLAAKLMSAGHPAASP
jgi:hypothetical protein